MLMIATTITGVWLLAGLAFLFCLHQAPEGYEDQFGFHFGQETTLDAVSPEEEHTDHAPTDRSSIQAAPRLSVDYKAKEILFGPGPLPPEFHS